MFATRDFAENKALLGRPATKESFCFGVQKNGFNFKLRSFPLQSPFSPKAGEFIRFHLDLSFPSVRTHWASDWKAKGGIKKEKKREEEVEVAVERRRRERERETRHISSHID